MNVQIHRFLADPCRWDPRPLLPSPEKATVRCQSDVFWSATDPSWSYRKLDNKGRLFCFDRAYFEWQLGHVGQPRKRRTPERNFRRGEQQKSRAQTLSRIWIWWNVEMLLVHSWHNYPILWMNGWQILHFHARRSNHEPGEGGAGWKLKFLGMVMTDGDLFCSNSADLLCFSSPQNSICYFFWVFNSWAMGHFFLETLPSRRSHRCDLSHRCADCLWMLVPWRLPWWSRGWRNNPWEADPRFNDSLCHTLGAVKPKGLKKGCVSHVFFGCFRTYAGRISKFPPDFFVPWFFSGPKEKASRDLSFSVTSQQVPRSIPRVLWRKASDGMWGAELMKVDREVPMGMMGCLQILLGGTMEW